MFFSCSRIHPGYHSTFSRHVSLISSGLWQFLRLALLLMTLSVWGMLVGYFVGCRMSLSLGFSHIFPDYVGVYGVSGKENHKSGVLLLPHCMKGTCLHPDLASWCWPWSPGQSSVGRFLSIHLFPTLFHTPALWKQTTTHSVDSI